MNMKSADVIVKPEAGGGHVLVVEDGEHDVGGGVRASAAERDDGVHRAWPIMMQSGGLQPQSHDDDVELGRRPLNGE